MQPKRVVAISCVLFLTIAPVLLAQRNPPRDPSPSSSPPNQPGPSSNVPRDPNAPRRPLGESINFQNMIEKYDSRPVPGIEDPPQAQREKILRELLQLVDEKLKSQVSQTLKDSVQIDADALKTPEDKPSDEAAKAGSSALARLKKLRNRDTPTEEPQPSNDPQSDDDALVELPADQLVQLQSLLNDAADTSAGRRIYEPIVFRKRIDRSSPLPGTELPKLIINEVYSQYGEPSANSVHGLGEKWIRGHSGWAFDSATIKSWSISGDTDDRPTEEVAFYYNKIAFAYSSTTDGKKRGTSGQGWGPWEVSLKPVLNAGSTPNSQQYFHPKGFQIISAGKDKTGTGIPNDRFQLPTRSLPQVWMTVGFFEAADDSTNPEKKSGPDQFFGHRSSRNGNESAIESIELAHEGFERGQQASSSKRSANTISLGSAGGGTWSLPEIGDAVLLGFTPGDPSSIEPTGLENPNLAFYLPASNNGQGYNPETISRTMSVRSSTDSAQRHTQFVQLTTQLMNELHPGNRSLRDLFSANRGSVQSGDVLLERWQRSGIGHAAKIDSFSFKQKVSEQGNHRFNGKYFVTGATHQYDKVEVHGWDPVKKERIVGEAGSTHDRRGQSLYFPESMLQEIQQPASAHGRVKVQFQWDRDSSTATAYIPGGTVISPAISSLNEGTKPAGPNLTVPLRQDNRQGADLQVSTYNELLPTRAPALAGPGTSADPYQLTFGSRPSGVASIRNEQLNNKYPENMKHEVREHVSLLPGLAMRMQGTQTHAVSKDEKITIHGHRTEMPPASLPGGKMASGLKSNSTPGGGAQNEMRVWKSRSGHILRFQSSAVAQPSTANWGMISLSGHLTKDRNSIGAPASNTIVQPLDEVNQQTSIFQRNESDMAFLKRLASRNGYQTSASSSSAHGFYDALISEMTLPAMDVNFQPSPFDAVRMPGPPAPPVPFPFPNAASSNPKTAFGDPAAKSAFSFDVKLEGKNALKSMPSLGHELAHAVQNRAGTHSTGQSGASDDKASRWIRVMQPPLGGSMVVPSQTKVLILAPASNPDSPANGSRNGNLRLGEFSSTLPPPATASFEFIKAWPARWTVPESNANRSNDRASMWFRMSQPHSGSGNGPTAQASTVGVNESVTVGAAQEGSVGADQTISVGAMRSITVGSNQSNSGVDRSLKTGAPLLETKTIIGGFKSMSGMDSETASFFKSVSGLKSESEAVDGAGGYPTNLRFRRDAEKGNDEPLDPFSTVDGVRVPDPVGNNQPSSSPPGVPIPYPNLGTSSSSSSASGDLNQPVIIGSLWNGSPKGDAPGQKAQSSPFEIIQASYSAAASAQISPTEDSTIHGYDRSHRLNRGTK